VEDSYDGPRIKPEGIDSEFIDGMIERFRQEKKIHKKYAYQVCNYHYYCNYYRIIMTYCFLLLSLLLNIDHIGSASVFPRTAIVNRC
jgi:hypothetical protein